MILYQLVLFCWGFLLYRWMHFLCLCFFFFSSSSSSFQLVYTSRSYCYHAQAHPLSMCEYIYSLLLVIFIHCPLHVLQLNTLSSHLHYQVTSKSLYIILSSCVIVFAGHCPELIMFYFTRGTYSSWCVSYPSEIILPLCILVTHCHFVLH